MGILDMLGITSTPVETQGGEVVGPVGGWGGLLSTIGQKLANNSDQLTGFGMGLLSGEDPQAGFANALTGLRQGQLIARQKAKDQQEKDTLASRKSALSKAFAGNSELAPYADAASASPDLGEKILAAKAASDLSPDKFDRVQGSDGSYYAVNKTNPSDVRKLGVPGASPQWTGVNIKNPDGTEETMLQRGGQFAKPGDVIPGYGTATAGATQPIPGQEIAAPPPGADPKAWREQMTKEAAKQAAGANASSGTAQNALDSVDRALGAYNKLGAGGGIGPVVGSSVGRTLGAIGHTDNEALRQEYDAARSNLELMKAQVSMKGQGAISDGERRLLKMTLPALDAVDPSTGMKTLLQYRKELQDVVSAGNQSGLPDRTGRGAGPMQGQTPNGISWGVKR